MTDSYQNYISGGNPLPESNRMWLLYGAGLDNFGVNDHPVDAPFPNFGPNDLFIRHDACGLCYSDIKVIRQGQSHPRIITNMRKKPVALGHEVCFTVVGVGDNLKGSYKIGDRLTLQPDIFINDVGHAYGYVYQGGLSQYSIIPPEIRNTDRGDMLIRLPDGMEYAEASLIEPWACVLAAYRWNYRDHLQPGGRLWIIGDKNHASPDFHQAIRDFPPAEIWVSRISKKLTLELLALKKQFGFKFIEVNPINKASKFEVDDIILINPTAVLIETVSHKLADHGIMALCTDQPLERSPEIDVGRIHYNRWLYIAGGSNDIAEIYTKTRVRSEIKANGNCWLAGSGGPIGRMHVQRAISAPHPPKQILCTDINSARLESLVKTYGREAEQFGINFTCLNPMDKDFYEQKMNQFKTHGFNDIIVLAPVPEMISECSAFLAENGVMNIFAGIQRGIKTSLDFNTLIKNNARFIGHSGSKLDDMLSVLKKWKMGDLSTNRSVAAIGSLEAAKEGYQALLEGRFPGKVVIYPHIRPFPLTGLPELEEKCPSVYDKLSPEGHWTNAAEVEFLKHMLP